MVRERLERTLVVLTYYIVILLESIKLTTSAEDVLPLTKVP